MTRFLALAALLVPATAIAGDYGATPSGAASGRVITKSASWTCGATGCVARTEASRPLVICQGLAKQVGILSNFSVDGRALGADDLAKCNALAKAGAAPAGQALAKN